MKKVLELFGEPIANGGQEAFVINALTHMDLTDLQIDLLTPYECTNEYYRSIVEDNGGKVYSLHFPFNPGGNRTSLYKPLYRFMGKMKYDVIHIHSGSISVLAIGACAARHAGTKCVIVHSHVAGENRTLKYFLVRVISYPFIKMFPTTYCACSQAAGDWKYPKSIARKKLKILKNGVDLEKYSFNAESRKKMRNMLNLDEKAFVVGHVGRFTYQKNHRYLIEIFVEVKQYIHNAKLLLVGDGELREDVFQYAKTKGISQDIIFTGMVNNVNDYLQVMDVFALPSRFEGLPIVGVETQAMGIPLLCSDCVSKELKISEGIQFLPLEDQQAWVDAIIARPERKDNKEQIKRNGYDIYDTALAMRKMYLHDEHEN